MHAITKARGAQQIRRNSNYIQQQIYTVMFWSKTKIQKRKSIRQVLSLFNILIWSSSYYPSRYLSFESHHRVTRVQQHLWRFLNVPPFYVCQELKHSQKRNDSQYSWKEKCTTFLFYMEDQLLNALELLVKLWVINDDNVLCQCKVVCTSKYADS